MFLIDDLLKGLGQKKAAKEQYKKAELQSNDQFAADKNAEMNSEDQRGARVNFLNTQMTGLRALSPEVLAALLKRKASTAVKGQVVDQSKGAMFNTLGNMANSAGNLAGMYMKGLGMPKNDAGTATSLRPTAATQFTAPGIEGFNPWLDRK